MEHNYYVNFLRRAVISPKVGLFFLFVLFSSAAIAQHSVRGIVTNEKGEVLVGASAIVQGTKKGASTNAEGVFVIDGLSSGNYAITISSLSYSSQTVRIIVPMKTELKITLAESTAKLEEVIVTGVFDKRKRIDASVAISTMSARDIRLQAPESAVDLLKNVPGVYVNSSAGEIKNQVVVRGTPISNNVSSGYYYVSMQEDGLPVTNLTGGNFGPDYFLRSDATIDKLEAVRGGSSSITGSDSPGGVFNYVSKSGTSKLNGLFELKYGIEGNGNPFKRADFNIGGPLGSKGDITYNVGGYYRVSDGARNPGYTLNYGGQIKGNFIKKYEKGSLKLYYKYLNDHNGFFDFLPYTNFDNPTVVSGFKNTDTFVGSGSSDYDFQFYQGGPTVQYRPQNLIKNRDLAIGLDWHQDLGNGWSVSNNVKFSSKVSNGSYQIPLSIMDVSGFTFAGFTGYLFNSGGVFRINDLATGQNLFTLNNNFPSLKIANDNLPNNTIMKSPIIWTVGYQKDIKLNELMDQFIINKVIGKSTFTLGGYIGISNIDSKDGIAGQQYVTFENRPRPLSLTYTQKNGTVIQYTNPQGWLNTGGNYRDNLVTNNRVDLFFAQTSSLTEKLTLDYGLRYNYSAYTGTTKGQITDLAIKAAGGLDKNLLTDYDSNVFNLDTWTFDKSYNSLSFSGALNYKITEQQAVYGRYSTGNKAPDVSAITEPTSKEAANLLSLEPITMTQAEIGYKAQFKNISAYVTPFYSKVSKIPSYSWASAGNGISYYTPVVYSEQETKGVELETNINISPKFSIRAAGTFQDPKSIVSRSWDTRKDGIADDTLLVKNNASVALTPKVMASITPTFQTGQFNIFLTWRYVGSAPANALGAFDLPAYQLVNLGAGYKLSKHIDARVNVNNLFDSYGVTGWYPPGGFPSSLFPQNFTPEARAKSPDAIWGARTTPPRSFFVTLSYRF